jgi:hypothetical protein
MINHDPFAGASNRARWMIGLPLKVRTRTPKRTKPDLVKLFGLSPAELEQADPWFTVDRFALMVCELAGVGPEEPTAVQERQLRAAQRANDEDDWEGNPSCPVGNPPLPNRGRERL